MSPSSIGIFCRLVFIVFAVSRIYGDEMIQAQVSQRHDELRNFALSHTGDPERGRILFGDQRTHCSKCHRTDGTSAVGANLSSIGHKFNRNDLITSILEPSKAIAIGFSTTSIVTKNGVVYTGILNRITETETVLVDKEHKPIRIPTGDIDEQVETSVSMMPAGLEQQLTPDEFADLIAYLESLRAVASNLSESGVTNRVPLASSGVQIEACFDSLRFDHPVWFGQIPVEGRESEADDRYLVLELAGKGFEIRRDDSKWTKRQRFDLNGSIHVGGGSGLLGMAFHPNFHRNRRCFLKYQSVHENRLQTVIAEFNYPVDVNDFDVLKFKPVMTVDAVTQDHNGGSLEFGPDGFLYIGMGDSGPQGDPQGHGQDLTTLTGKILRIDVNQSAGELAYTIPPDNPFVSASGARPEIWAYGFREPWRFSFDPVTRELWVGDVGQNRVEEVAIVSAGENHGWNVFEGHAEHSRDFRKSDARYISPIFSYSRALGVSITGGYVYRGKDSPVLNGWYICGDFESRRIWALRRQDTSATSVIEIGRAPSRIVSFGQDTLRQLYVVGYDDGEIYRMNFESTDLTPGVTNVIAETSQDTAVLWKYTTAIPKSGWDAPDFDDSHWKSGPGGFGTTGTPGAVVRTDWNSRDIWIRRSFELTRSIADDSKLSILMHHDEDVEVYLNGVLALQRNGWTSGYNEFDFSPEARHALHTGRNVIAIHCRQTSGGQYIDAGFVEYQGPPR